MRLLLLMLCLSTALAQPCELSHVSFQWRDTVDMWLVGYIESPCSSNSDISYFCEGSGWGDEEATVVCREQGYKYGIGRHIGIESRRGGYRHIMCQGTENKLEECNIGAVTYQYCSSVAVVSQCSNVPQIYVTKLNYLSRIGYYLTTNEEQQSMQFCIVTNGVLTEAPYIHVGTKPTTSLHPPAIADYDYEPLHFTYTYELDQCLEIEIINDPLAENWEVFSVLLSTNSSAVNITTHTINIYIEPNDDDSGCFEGNITAVSDVNNSSLQVVEMCNSEGVWSPLCNNNLTLENATDVCTKLGYQGLDLEGSVQSQSGSVAYKCQGNEVTLVDCAITSSTETSCYYALGKCMDTDNECSSIHMRCNYNRATSTPVNPSTNPSTNTPTPITSDDDHPKDSSGGTAGIVAGVVVSLVVVLTAVIVVVVVLIVWLRRKTGNFKPASSDGSLQPPSVAPTATTERNGTKLASLSNPTYEPNIIRPAPPPGSPEHKFINPLYTPVRIGSSGDFLVSIYDGNPYECVKTTLDEN